MDCLVIKIDVRAKGGQDFRFADASEEKGLVDPHIPIPERLDRAFMRGGHFVR